MSPPWDLRSKGLIAGLCRLHWRGWAERSLCWECDQNQSDRGPHAAGAPRGMVGCGQFLLGCFLPHLPSLSFLPGSSTPPPRPPRPQDCGGCSVLRGKFSAARGLLSRRLHSPGFYMVQGPVLKIWKPATLESLSHPPIPPKGMPKKEGHMSNSSPRGCIVTCHLGGGSPGGEDQAARAVRPPLGCGGPLAGVSAQTSAC